MNDQSSQLNLSIVLPAHNEAECLQRSVEQLLQALRSTTYTYEIIIADDASTDATPDVISFLSSTHDSIRSVRVEAHDQGKGSALRLGGKEATGSFILFFDADGDFDPNSIPSMMQFLHEGAYDGVIASKWHPDSNVCYPFTRRLMSRFFRLYTFLLFRLPYRDTQAGMKIWKCDALRAILPYCQSKGFAFDVELMVHAQKANFNIAEFPVTIPAMKRSRMPGQKHELLHTLREVWHIQH